MDVPGIEMFKITKTTRNKIMLNDGIHEYYLNSKTQNRMYWICTKSAICNARLTTNIIIDINTDIVAYKTTEHTHMGDANTIKIREVTEKIKKKALSNPNSQPSVLIQEELRPIINSDVLIGITEKTSLLRKVNRIQNSSRPCIPELCSQCIILPPYDKTYLGEDFLRYDSGVNDPDRILIFYSDNGLRSLVRSAQIFADGTFDTVPNIFFQLYTIHGQIFDYTFPLVYVLCLRKSKVTYKKIYDHIVNAALFIGLIFNPEMIMMDFESAAINAVLECLPTSIVKGCLFHFNQSLWRRIQESGLSTLYVNSENQMFKDSVLRFMALPFIPEEDLLDIFKDLVKTSSNILEGFVSYLGKNYIGIHLNGDIWNVCTPRFGIHTWNTYNSVLSGLRRTNNVVEGWHSRFQKVVVSKHATIWRFLDFIKNDERDNDVLITQLNGGHRKIRHPVKNQYIVNNKNIELLVRSYDEYKRNNQINDYLLNIGKMLKSNFASGPKK